MNFLSKIAMASLIWVCAVNAQLGSPTFGATAGTGQAGYVYNKGIFKDMTPGLSPAGGLVMVLPWGEKIEGVAQLLLSVRTANLVNLGNVEVEVNEKSVDLPLLLRYKFYQGAFVQAGPQMGLNIGSEMVVGGVATTNDDRLRPDFGLTGGLGYKFTQHFEADIRYHYGMTDIMDNVGDFKPYYFLVAATYML